MKALSGFDKCTICLEESKLTFEHIIPSSIGGFLEADLQCKKCNSSLGNQLILKAKKIYPIRFAIQSLKNVLPSLYNAIEEGQQYTAKSSDNSVTTAFFRKGDIVSKAGKDEKGVLTVDRKDTESNLRNILKKEGFSEADISQKLNLLKTHKNDKPIKLSDSLTAIKRKFIDLHPKSDEVDMDNRIVTLIAYNYLCITVGETIFHHSFDEVRNYILNGNETKNILIEQYPYNGPYEPYHKIYRKTVDNRAKVTIILFGSIAYEVTFLCIQILSDNNYVIIQDLEGKKIYFSETIADAKEGIYYVI